MKSIYGLNEGTCRYSWQINFFLPVFRDTSPKVNRSETEKILKEAGETTLVDEHNQSFLEKMSAMALCMLSLKSQFHLQEKNLSEEW